MSWLHDATAGDGVRRQGVAREVGAVDEENVDALPSQQHGGSGAANAGANDDDLG